MNADHIVEIFRRLLNAPEVNQNSNFFELGGDSLLATRVLSAIAREFGTELRYEDFVENPSPEGLFARVACRSAMNSGCLRVVVVGAGLAGLTAAVDLVEAGDRVGGRMHGAPISASLRADGGAAYLGAQHTELLAMLREYGLDLAPTKMVGESPGLESADYICESDATAERCRARRAVRSA